MSGASANAAARRRRGVSQQSSNNYTTQEKSNSKITTNNSSVPTLTVPQILIQLDKRLSLIENKFNTPSESMLDINGNIDVNLFPQRFGELDRKLANVEQKISGLENNISDNVISRLNNFASSISALENKLDSVNVSNTGDNNVSKEEFNTIMSNVGDDVGVLTDQVSDLKDLVLNIQNSTILLDKTIIEINNEFRSNKSDLIKEMEKEIAKNEYMEISAMEEVLEETSVVLEENNNNINEQDEKKKETSENIELQVEDKEVTQEAIKEEVSVVVNDELIKKLKMLNAVSSDNNDTKEEEKSSEA